MISGVTRSIAAKMTLLVLLGSSFVLVVIVAYNYIYSKDLILQEAKQYARNLTLSVTRRIEQEFRSLEKVPEGLAEYLRIHPCDNEEQLLALIRSSVRSNPEVFGGAAVFEPGAFVNDLPAYAPYYYKTKGGLKFLQLASPSYNYFQQDYYHIVKLLLAPLWTNPYFDEGGGEILMVTYSVPLFGPDKNGEKSVFKGIITADLSLDWLSTLMSSIRVEDTGFCFIISNTGKFVSYPRKEYIMRESIFSVAEETGKPRLREVGRLMIREKSGFVDIGKALTGDDAFLAYAQIPSSGWALGAVFPHKELFAELTSLHRRSILIAAFGIGLLLLLSRLVAQSLARPLVKMADATKQVAKGDLDVDLSDIRSKDEVGRLARAFDQMIEGLKQRDFIRDTFGRYLTKEVVSRLLESKDGLKLGGEAREITLLMSDLRGFTALTSHMPPDQIIRLLNRYLGKMLEILLDHRGVVDEIIGDGILAFFGAPEPIVDHPVRAVACALQMQSAMNEINALNVKDGLAHLEMGIAIHTGTVVVGNIGSERRSKYGAVGSDVNFTGRIEGYSVGGQVLISQDTYERVMKYVTVRNTMSIRMKGIPDTVTLYDIKGMTGPFEITLRDRDETPQPLSRKIRVKVGRLRKKVVDAKGADAWITHVSQTSAILILSQPIGQWEEIRILLLESATDMGQGEVYGKVMSIQEGKDGHEAVVRLTSMSPQVYEALRKDIGP